jgi:hypothetical protein
VENSLIKNDLTAKLKYLGLNLEEIPECLYDFHALNFNVSRLNNDKDHKVFRFVPIEKIEILLTPSLRSDTVREKYSKALPLSQYLKGDESEEGIERYTTLLKMLSSFSITDVEAISNIQKEMKNGVPFRVKYNKEHLWQIYYSESTDRYFMLVCTKESTFAEFFYLLKKKIEMTTKKFKEPPMIFVPINYINYSETFLNRDEIVDCENYLWLFTKNWPVIYEVYDKENKMSLQIIGETFVYETIKSTYKINLTSSEEAIKFYKWIKAAFIMQTEIKGYFSFSTKINSKNELELYYENNKITYDNLTDFIKSRFAFAKEEIEKQNTQIKELQTKLEKLKKESTAKETEYIQRQREIGAFLECRKTFMGKMKYFFKASKITKKIKKDVEKERYVPDLYNENVDKLENIVDTKPMEAYMSDKKYHTIEDLVVIYSMLEDSKKKCQNLVQDIKAMELKYENLRRKVENADLYIKEIDSHKKSIFDFWKFTSKDEVLSLEMGQTEEKSEVAKIKRVFDFESDFDILGVEMDKLQRRKFSKEETDSIFVANSKLINVINSLRKGELNEKQIKSSLKMLKEEFNKDRLYISEETFDIFGNITDDSRKPKYIGSRSHRENEKSKYKILNINKDIDEFDFTEKLQSIRAFVEGAIPKIKSKFDFSLYKLVEIPNVLNENDLMIANINVENELKDYEDKGDGALNLLKVNFKENMPLIYYTNIIYYDNTNQTLPEGMNLSTQVLIDCEKFNFKLVNKTKFRTNNYFRESNNLILPKSKDIFVYEYDVELKK